MIGTDVVATIDSVCTGVPSIYHVYCEVLIRKLITPARCTICKKHRKSLLMMMALCNQKDERVHPSSHTNYSYLSKPEKDECLHHLHTQCKISRLHIVQLERKLLESIKESGIHLDQDFDKDMKLILADTSKEIDRCYHPQSFQHLFWDQ